MAAEITPDYLLTHPAPQVAEVTVRPKRAEAKPLTRDQAETLVRKYNPDITDAAVQGEVDNIFRESAGNSADDTGDGGTSAGLYQDHNERKAGMIKFAAEHGADWTDPATQVLYARWEKEHMFPSLLKYQQTAQDRTQANEQFKRVFERPASVMWQNGPNGQPVIASDRFRFSEHALNDAKRRGGDDSV